MMPSRSSSRLSFLKIRRKKPSKDQKREEPPGTAADGCEAGGGLNDQWFDAVKNQDIGRVSDLLHRGADVNCMAEQGWSGLHIAAWNNYSELCSTLLSADADVNQVGASGSTPLTLASQQGYVDIVKQLIGANCDVNKSASLSNNSDVTALHLASQNGHTAVVKVLIEANAVVNATMNAGGIMGVTPLHLAVQAEHLEVMDVLIAAGCDVQSSTQGSSASESDKSLTSETSC